MSSDVLHVPCPGCGQGYPWLEKFAGRKVLCRCGVKMRLPATPDGPVLVVEVASAEEAKRREAARRKQTQRAAPGSPGPGSPQPPATPPAGSSAPNNPPQDGSLLVPPTRDRPARTSDEGGEEVDLLALSTEAADTGGASDRSLLDDQPTGAMELNLPDDAGALDLSDALANEGAASTPPVEQAPQPTASAEDDAARTGPPCPSCELRLNEGSTICVPCGIHINTGRPLIVSRQGDLDTIYNRAHLVIRGLSWLLFMGLYPIASEAHGGRKPLATWAIAAATVLASCTFWGYAWFEAGSMGSLKQMMLWAGDGEPDIDRLRLMYAFTDYGDEQALDAEVDKIKQEREQAAEQARLDEQRKRREQALSDPGWQIDPSAVAAAPTPSEEPQAEPEPTKPAWLEDLSFSDLMNLTDEQRAELETYYAGSFDREVVSDEDYLAAHERLPVEKRATGEYRPHQLLTHAMLHADLFHLAGNLLFLLIFGSRVNALIGNIPTLAIYPVLAVAAALAQAESMASEGPQAMLGASGAIMGLAGAYLVLFPIHKLHMAWWIRPGVLLLYIFVPMLIIVGLCMAWLLLPMLMALFFARKFLFHMFFSTFTMAGFWLLLLNVGFQDVLMVVLGRDDGVAHWAHLGGFIAGFAIASLLLVSRGVNTRGSDLYSLVFGRWAWPLLGRPSQWHLNGASPDGWAQRLLIPLPPLPALPTLPTRKPRA